MMHRALRILGILKCKRAITIVLRKFLPSEYKAVLCIVLRELYFILRPRFLYDVQKTVRNFAMK